MADSIIVICNSALSKLGAASITSLTDQTKEGATCNERYDACRKTVLRSHPWNCAMNRVVLAPITLVPAYGYSVYYQLPGDFLRLVSFNPLTEDKYAIENGMIATDASTVYLKYAMNVIDTTKFDPLLDEAIAWYLAKDICYKITQSLQLTDYCEKQYDKYMRKAKSVDSQQNPSPEVEANLFLNSRVGPVSSSTAQEIVW